MSLNTEQKKQTSIELYENYRISELASEKIQADLGLDARELEKTLNVGLGVDPTTVWRLRDYMEDKIKEQGKTPYPYSILIENIYFPYEKDWENKK